jgi:hypothetical protein
MGIKPDKRYNGTVAPGSQLMESQNGTLGFQVMLECEDGPTSFTIWLTERTKENAEKTFKNALGIEPEKLRDHNYIEMQLPLDIDGREVTFTTKDEEYNGKFKTKVNGLFKRSASAGGSPFKAAAAFFKGEKLGQGPATETNPITDGDIPF